MRMSLPIALLISLSALPATAQIVAPAPVAGPGADAAIAHHDRKVARRAARHGNYRKAAMASHAANAAAADASVAPR